MKKLKILTPSSPALPAAERREDERSEADRSAAAGNAGTGLPGVPDPEVVARAKRRRFTADYKLRVLDEVDQATEAGAIGAVLRREGLFSSHLTTWRRERKTGILQALTPRKRGPKSKRNPLAEENQKLQRTNQRLTEQLRKAEIIIDVQKKVAALLGHPIPDADPENQS
jgi:transposase-like protein